MSMSEELSNTTDLQAEEEGGKTLVVDSEGNYFNVFYSRSFTARLIQSGDETQKIYGELKNEALSYEKTSSCIWWAYDSVSAGKKPIVKFGICGKTLCMYLPLDADDYADSDYKMEKIESERYAAVPCMYRVESEENLGLAKELIAAICFNAGLTKGDVAEEDYRLPYEDTEVLVAKGLIKKFKAAATAAQIECAKRNITLNLVKSVSATEVTTMISDEIATAAIEVSPTIFLHTGKKGIINVDTLSANFPSGETITIELLKKRGLIPQNIGQVKLLARGNLDKVFHVELQDYSIDAVKMVIATGGTVKTC